jgi:8-oxo-dGTP pyrophosphatase MutT (NUDIX family)
VKKSVGAIIYFKNLYLIQKRSLKINIYFPGVFGVFGGNVNEKEKVHQAIFREIKEELDIDLNYHQVKYFLKISINSKHFKKNRSRYYYSIKITKSQLNSIVLKEGDSYHLLNLRKLNKLNFVPWDLSAILYFENYIRQKRSVKPKKF